MQGPARFPPGATKHGHKEAVTVGQVGAHSSESVAGHTQGEGWGKMEFKVMAAAAAGNESRWSSHCPALSSNCLLK